MLSIFKSIYAKLFFSEEKKAILYYLKNKNIQIGKNSDIKNLKIVILGAEPGITYVSIGQNCLLHGEIILYHKESRLKIGDQVYMGPDTKIICYKFISVGSNVMISWGCTLIDTNSHSLLLEDRKQDVIDWKKGWKYKNWKNVITEKIIVNDFCWIGFNSIILKGVELGKNVIVGAGSVVTKSFKENVIIGGNPSKIIKQND